MDRLVTVISVLLLAFHAQCMAACNLLPCENHVRQSAPPAPASSCHHHEQAPADSGDHSSCGHQQLVSEGGVRVAAPIFPVISLASPERMMIGELVPSSAHELADLHAPPPLPSAAASRAILRI